jgi:hypothetical protein
LKVQNSVEKNDRNNVVHNALTKNTTEKFGLLTVINNANSCDYVRAAK